MSAISEVLGDSAPMPPCSTPLAIDLLHVSEIAHHRVKDVRDEWREGDHVMVKEINIDPTGRIRLSRKALLAAAETAVEGAQP